MKHLEITITSITMLIQSTIFLIGPLLNNMNKQFFPKILVSMNKRFSIMAIVIPNNLQGKNEWVMRGETRYCFNVEFYKNIFLKSIPQLFQF